MPRPRPAATRLAGVVAVLVLLGALIGGVGGGEAEAVDDQRRDASALEYFYGDGCPYCALQGAFLDELEVEHPWLVIRRHEVWGDRANQRLLVDTVRPLGVEPTGVPVTVYDGRVWVGFNEQVAGEILAAVRAREAGRPPPVEAATSPVIEVPLVGSVTLGGRSLVAATVLIAVVDGFNPCSLWVLTVLLAMVVNAGVTRGRIIAVGGTFLLVTAAIYGVFIAGLFRVFGLAGMTGWIAVAVGTLAIAFGALNVKDYLVYRRGVSLTIPDRAKPRIYRQARAVRRVDRPLPTVLALTVAMAGGVALLELPCTAGFPVVWTGLLAANDVGASQFAGLLSLYLGVYLLDEVVLFVVVVTTLRLARVEERHGRALKLVGGVVMLALGVVMLVDPGLMASLGGALGVVLGSIALAALLLVVHRRVLPRWGIALGDEAMVASRASRPGPDAADDGERS